MTGIVSPSLIRNPNFRRVKTRFPYSVGSLAGTLNPGLQAPNPMHFLMEIRTRRRLQSRNVDSS